MNTITITATQKTELSGFITDVRDTSVVSLYLRKYENDNGTGSVIEYQGISQGDGQFNFLYEDGNMQLWKAPLPSTDAAYRIDSWHGGPVKTRWLGDKTLPYLPSGVNLDLTAISLLVATAVANGNPTTLLQINNLLAPINAQLLTTYTQAQVDNKFIMKALGEALQIVRTAITFLDFCPTTAKDPLTTSSLTRRSWVQSHVASSINTAFAGYNPALQQQSPNIVRVIPAGVQEDNRVYRTFEVALNWAFLNSTPTRRIIIRVEGDAAGTTPPFDYNKWFTSNDIPYVDIECLQGLEIRLDETIYDTATRGDNIISGAILVNESDSGSVTFVKKIFYNCHFLSSFVPANGTFIFTSCRFIGCTTNVVNTYTTCQGTVLVV